MLPAPVLHTSSFKRTYLRRSTLLQRSRATNLAVIALSTFCALSFLLNIRLSLYPTKEAARSPPLHPISPSPQLPANFNHLIIVPGHAIWQGFDPNLRTKASEWAFESFGANQDSDRLEVFVKHIVRAAQIAAEDDKSLVVFSGGQTQPASTTTEGESYLRLAIKMDLFPGNPRATSENFALDSFQNLLFSVARFFEVTRRYPTKITVVGFEIKRARFEQLHRAAIRWPQSRFEYIGIDAAGDNTLAQQGELENGFIPFTEDSYGCHDFLLSKRTRRNYAARYPPYELTNPRLAALLGWCPQKQTELFHDVLPWPVLHD